MTYKKNKVVVESLYKNVVVVLMMMNITFLKHRSETAAQ